MNAVAALLVLAAIGGSSQPGHAQEAEAAPRVLLAQAGTPPPGPMSPPAQSPPSVGAPAPTPKIDNLPEGPPLGSLSLSQLMLKVEGEPEFAYVREVDWRDGKYAVTFVTRDGQSHKKMFDPRTGRASQPSPNQTGAGGPSESDSGNTGGSRGPVLNPTGTPSNAPTTAPRPAGPTR